MFMLMYSIFYVISPNIEISSVKYKLHLCSDKYGAFTDLRRSQCRVFAIMKNGFPVLFMGLFFIMGGVLYILMLAYRPIYKVILCTD